VYAAAVKHHRRVVTIEGVWLYQCGRMSASTLSVGTILADRYVLASLAPVSNAPEAWCASMVGNEQPVMVLYFPAGSFEPRAMQRIVTEGAELRELRHPRVGALLDLAVEARGGVYAVTPWYGDDTLARRVERQGAFNLHVASALVGDVLAPSACCTPAASRTARCRPGTSPSSSPTTAGCARG
jgi:hypothetical protein